MLLCMPRRFGRINSQGSSEFQVPSLLAAQLRFPSCLVALVALRFVVLFSSHPCPPRTSLLSEEANSDPPPGCCSSRDYFFHSMSSWHALFYHHFTQCCLLATLCSVIGFLILIPSVHSQQLSSDNTYSCGINVERRMYCWGSTSNDQCHGHDTSLAAGSNVDSLPLTGARSSSCRPQLLLSLMFPLTAATAEARSASRSGR
jgi:hypothetical protein